MENCYTVLGVRPDATAAEIRRAFRKRAKELHPDSTGRSHNSRAFDKLVQAYRVLADEKQRAVFDEAYFTGRAVGSGDGSISFDYHEWLSARTDDESRAKLIFWDVMHGREDEAAAEFKRMSCKPTFSLRRWFSYEDFMDYGFILAEELAARAEYYDAFNLLEQIILSEKRRAYFRLFFPEVMEFARMICRYKIIGALSDELLLDVWERALDLGFSAADDAFFLRRMGEAYLRLGDKRLAELCFAEAARG